MLSSEKEFMFHFGWDDLFESQIPDLVGFSGDPQGSACSRFKKGASC